MEDLEKERDLYKANLIKIFKLQMDHTQEMWEMLNTIFDRKNGDQDGNEPLPYKPRNGVFLLMEDLENMMNASYEAGRESVIQGGNEPLPFRYVAPNKPRNED